MADQEPGEIAGEHAVSNLLGIVVRIDPCDIAAGGHDGADWPICQPENAFDHPSLHLLENAAFGAFGNQADDLLLGDRLIASRLHAKEPQHHPRGPAKPGDHRPTYARDEPHRPCDASRYALGVPERYLFWNQLTENQGEIGQSDDDDDERNGAAIWSDQGKSVQRLPELFCQGRAAEGACEDANQRNADLDGGQEFARIARQLQGDLGTSVPLAGEPLQPAPPRGHDRQLGHRKEAVEHQQQHDDRDLEDHHFVIPIDLKLRCR